jgi:hypothetical protein
MLPSRESETAVFSETVVRYFKIDRKDLVYLKFILEAYEGMSTLSTVEPKEVIVRLSIPQGFEADIQAVLSSVSESIQLEEVTYDHGDSLNA